MKRNYSIAVLLLTLILGFASCSKDDVDARKSADGTYQITEIEIDGELYTKAIGISGEVIITGKGTNMELTYRFDGNVVGQDSGPISIKASGEILEISTNGEKVGTINGDVLEMSQEVDGDDVRIRAVR